MHSDSRKKANARENGCENGKSKRPEEVFCQAMAELMGKEKLIDFIRMIQRHEEKDSKSGSDTGNGKAND
jgi:hypothetical protein